MISYIDLIEEITSKAWAGSSIKFDDFLYRSYKGNCLKSVSWLKHQIWRFLKEILWREWRQKRQVAQVSNLMMSYRDVIKEMASKAWGGSTIKFYHFLKRSYEGNGLKSDRWVNHQILLFLKEILWREWPQKRQVAQVSNLIISYIHLIEEMASKAWGGSTIKFGYFLRRSYEANGIKRFRWLKHQAL